MLSFIQRLVLPLLLLFAFCLSALTACADTTPKERKKRQWKVIILVPEQHLARPRIPDPAVETEISRQLIDEGYKVIDQDRVAELRYSEVMDRIKKGSPEADKEIEQLRRRFGADLFITGEAFTQEVQRQTVQTDLGPVLQIRCRARVELKGIRMDSGEKFYAGSLQKTGSPEPTEELSSKACLEETAAELTPTLLDKLAKLSLSATQHIEMTVRGIASISLANQFSDVLQKVPGVLEVTPGDFDAQTYTVEVLLDKIELRAFAARLEENASLKKFHLKVQSASGTKIILNCQ